METFTQEKQFEKCKKCLNRKETYSNLSDICNIKGQKKEFTDFCTDFDLDKKFEQKSHNGDLELLTRKKRENTSITATFEQARITIFLIWTVLALDIISALSSYMQYDLLQKVKDGVELSQGVIENNDLREQSIAIIYIIVYIISGIYFIRWLRNSYRNLYARNINLKHDENWTIWGWFVPILNIVRPYQMMSDIFNKAEQYIHTKNKGFENSKFSIVGWWWAFWLLNNYVDKFVLRTGLHGETVDDFMISSLGDIINSAIGVILALITILMIKSYQEKEEEMRMYDKEKMIL